MGSKFDFMNLGSINFDVCYIWVLDPTLYFLYYGGM